jgi:hypothetical protein
MLAKILEPILYLGAWLYFHMKLGIEAIVKFVKFTIVSRIELSIHTFIGAGLAVFYYYLFTGEIEQFHGFYDALPLVSKWSSGREDIGSIFGIAIASVLMITLSRGFFVFIGYTLVFWLYVILSSFETPKPIEPKMTEYKFVGIAFAPKGTIEKASKKQI